MAMEAMRVRIVAPIPGKGVVGIEVPNRDRETVYLKEIVEQDVFQRSSSKLTMALGKDIEGMPTSSTWPRRRTCSPRAPPGPASRSR
jgi:S-DNA-T family DNA segregation ATPase FtsK/SpoIIIE